jgi:hypothetical protein
MLLLASYDEWSISVMVGCVDVGTAFNEEEGD